MSKKLFILGAPNAGKTTFLGALDYSVVQNNVKTKLTLDNTTGEQQYVHMLGLKWSEVEDVGRTLIGQEIEHQLLHLTDGKNILELEFPDFSGETFQNIYENREIAMDLKEKIEDADAILYFINVEDIVPAQFISEVSKELRLKNDNQKERKPCDDDPLHIQTIDMLQIIDRLKNEPVRLGIVFSAWDLVEPDMQNDVEEYIKNKLNMLWQYMNSNKNKFSVKMWGVSAIGGKIQDASRLAEVDEPMERIMIINESGKKSHDLTTIIAEMLGETYDC